ncbi:unnamed protein product, partial [Mesorhabditis belari]|uniref:Phosphodiesterase n=1 Tax=Mesorhabditis belari TaxID=2138241 RepID=A0AAF3EVS4_9BILA
MPWCCARGAATPLLNEPGRPVPDPFGPMLIQPNPTALVITAGTGEGVFVERLKHQGWHVTIAPPHQAEPLCAQLRPHLVLLDNRLPDIVQMAKQLHQLASTLDDTFFVVISEKPISEKRRRSLSHADILHNVLWMSRDTSLVEWISRLSTRLRVVPALFAVLDEADQAVEVIDDARVVLYVNRAYENVTGCLRGEVVGQPESDMRRKSLPRPREEDRRRSSDWKCIRVPSSSCSNQYVYVKRRSLDGGIYRDVSLKSIRSQAMMEAPISEVISMLREAAGRCEGESAQLVKDAVKVLSSHELYLPNMQKIRDGDQRMAAQYYDGLVRLHHPSRQRKRSVVDAYKDKRGFHGERRRVSADVKNALENDHLWNFDILQLERITEHHALSQLGMKIFERWKVGEVLQCPEDILTRWLNTIELHYHAGNAYHNATHAADVLQATSYFLDQPSVADLVVDTHAVAALLAAAVHDLDHPGRGNAYLINTRQSLAILYNDQSVLENHHVALAFQLTLQQNSNVNIFGALSRDEFSTMRSAMVEMVLATDIRRHFEYVAKFNQMNLVDVADEQRDANSMIVCNMLVKCADISNPCREWGLCQKWAFRIVEEYFEQTREEKEKGLPLTMEFFDRESCNVPITQCGFVDMFVREAFTCWSEFAHLPHLLKQLETNYDAWKQQQPNWTPANNIGLLS